MSESGEDFFEFLDELTIDPTTGCWLPTTLTGHGGFVQIDTPDGKRLAHRVLYEIEYGPIAPGQHLHHLCGRLPCVNAKHLVAVWPAETAHKRTPSLEEELFEAVFRDQLFADALVRAAEDSEVSKGTVLEAALLFGSVSRFGEDA